MMLLSRTNQNNMRFIQLNILRKREETLKSNTSSPSVIKTSSWGSETTVGDSHSEGEKRQDASVASNTKGESDEIIDNVDMLFNEFTVFRGNLKELIAIYKKHHCSIKALNETRFDTAIKLDTMFGNSPIASAVAKGAPSPQAIFSSFFLGALRDDQVEYCKSAMNQEVDINKIGNSNISNEKDMAGEEAGPDKDFDDVIESHNEPGEKENSIRKERHADAKKERSASPSVHPPPQPRYDRSGDADPDIPSEHTSTHPQDPHSYPRNSVLRGHSNSYLNVIAEEDDDDFETCSVYTPGDLDDDDDDFKTRSDDEDDDFKTRSDDEDDDFETSSEDEDDDFETSSEDEDDDFETSSDYRSWDCGVADVASRLFVLLGNKIKIKNRNVLSQEIVNPEPDVSVDALTDETVLEALVTSKFEAGIIPRVVPQSSLGTLSGTTQKLSNIEIYEAPAVYSTLPRTEGIDPMGDNRSINEKRYCKSTGPISNEGEPVVVKVMGKNYITFNSSDGAKLRAIVNSPEPDEVVDYQADENNNGQPQGISNHDPDVMTFDLTTEKPQGSSGAPSGTTSKVSSYFDIHAASYIETKKYLDLHDNLVKYIEDWELTLLQCVHALYTVYMKHRKDLQHYIKKMDYLNTEMSKLQKTAEEKEKPLSTKKVERLDRNVVKLALAKAAHDSSGKSLCFFLDEVVNRSWRDVFPMLQRGFKLEQDYVAMQAEIFGKLKGTADLLELIATEHEDSSLKIISSREG